MVFHDAGDSRLDELSEPGPQAHTDARHLLRRRHLAEDLRGAKL